MTFPVLVTEPQRTWVHQSGSLDEGIAQFFVTWCNYRCCSVLEKHFDGDFGHDQGKEIIFKGWPPGTKAENFAATQWVNHSLCRSRYWPAPPLSGQKKLFRYVKEKSIKSRTKMANWSENSIWKKHVPKWEHSGLTQVQNVFLGILERFFWEAARLMVREELFFYFFILFFLTADSASWLFRPVGPHQCSAESVASWAREFMPSLDALHLWDKCKNTMPCQSAQITMVMSLHQGWQQWHPQSRVLNRCASTQGA